MYNRMILNQTSYFGAGCIEKITEEAQKSAFQKAFIVTDRPLVEHGIVAKVTALLDAESVPYDIFEGSVPNPTIAVVKSGLAAFHESGADYIIAIGGGSPIDTAKAIGIIATNPSFADVRSLEGVANTTEPCVPIFAVPTTSGTAAEVTINYVITDEEQQRKFVCVDPHDIPLVAFVDSDMMMSMPKSLCAATGMDALTHAIEGYITNAAWEMTDMLHIKAIEIIAGSLRDSVNEDPAGREKMALGQYIAGMGFSNVGLGLVHGMRIHSALGMTPRTASPTRSSCRQSWPITQHTLAINTAISREPWAFQIPKQCPSKKPEKQLSTQFPSFPKTLASQPH